MAKEAPPVEESPSAIVDQEFAQITEEHIRAGYQCMAISTHEENRAETEITRVAKKLGMGVITWDNFEGFSHPPLKNQAKYRDPAEALAMLADETTLSGNQVLIFRDLDDYFAGNFSVRRRLRSLCNSSRLVNRRYKRPIFIISPTVSIHDKLSGCIYPIDFRLPSEEKLQKVFEFVQTSIKADQKKQVECSEELREQIVGCLMGLTSTEAENALARCLVRHGGFAPEMLATLKDEKASIIKKSEVLTYIPEEGQVARSEIGGFENLLEFVDRRRLAYTRAARAEKLDYPKGIVLLGIPGTGKSMVAKAIAKILGLPALLLDVGAVFGSLVGESEKRMREVIRTVEAQQGCVLVLDEADKALGGATTSSGDSGVTRRVFGKLLTWLAEKSDRTFVVVTMNRTSDIPPEFLRAGRFDAVFYTDLPHADERRQILDIHFTKRGVALPALKMGKDEWSMLIDKTQDFIGSELEEVVREARYMSFERRQTGTPSFEEIMEAASSIVPMSTLDAEGLTAIRNFCKNRARPVSRPVGGGSGARERSVDVTSN